MADKRISELPSTASLNDVDLVPIVQAGDTKKLSAASLKAYTNSNVVLASEKGAISGVATLDSAGKLSSAQIPDISVVDYLGSAANQTAMLALTGQKGDWCTRADLGTTWVISGSNPTQLGSWTELSYPVAPVTSVAGKTGVVTLSKSDVGLGNVDNTADTSKPISTATQTALDLKVAKDSSTGSAFLPTGTTAQRTASPVAGLVRYNSTTQKFEGYGSAWGNLGGGAYIGDTAPSNPGNGDLWWNSASGHTYVYYGTAWVDLFGGAEGQYLPLTGGTISGNLAYTGTLTGGTGIINIGSGQIYKDASGNVGIGITPANRLHVYGDGSASLLKLQASNTNGNAMMNLVPNGTGNGVIYTETGSLLLAPSNSTRATFDSFGNVFLGNSSNANAGQRGLFVNGYTGSNYSALSLGASGSDYGLIGFNVGFTATTKSYKALNTDYMNWLQLDAGAFKFFQAGNVTAGTTQTGTQAMTLDASGKLAIGNTSAYGILDILANGNINSVHLTPSNNVDVGGYLNSTGNAELMLSGGANYNSYSSPNFVMNAKSAVACGVYLKGNAISFWVNTGLTAGTTFNQSEKASIDSNGNLIMGGPSAPTSAVGCLVMYNRSSNPTANIAGGTLYVEAGKLMYRGSSGTLTTLANA